MFALGRYRQLECVFTSAVIEKCQKFYMEFNLMELLIFNHF